ncbi:hypothetical protein [Fibrobacter succinogenes]|uniref:hypothetical protein n=1 Tax=Fibrobacter succinogenes TaxID=833 RepID=UPI001568A673|nr:hypothetical protein [Fibrobacter succinogenes]
MKSKYLMVALALSVNSSFAAKIGVLKNGVNVKCNGQFTIDLDVEDDNNRTGVVEGKYADLPNSGVVLSSGHAKFTYCVKNVSSAPKVRYDYVVLRLDASCPSGSYPFARHHDTEDDNNANSPKKSSVVRPSVVDDNATLEYCYVPKDSKASRKYPFEREYGVFSNYNSDKNNIAHVKIKIDDEDNHLKGDMFCYQTQFGTQCDQRRMNNNANLMIWYDSFYPSNIDVKKNAKKIVEDGDNTYYHVIKWKGGALAKSAGASESLDYSQMQYVTAAPFAPAIKGLNRNAVAVELKSVGDVKVSIVGVDGAVIANVSEKNLQAGSHQINWNAGMVPSGRYIVKVEQNGMVNAKSVILK